MKRVLREPLLHFAALALCIFGLFEWLAEPDAQLDDKVINVTRPALLEFIQYRTRSFNEGSAEQRLQSLTPSALDAVIQDYVREEALYRAALAYGLAENDYVIKRRMVQKVDFLAQGIAEAELAPEESALNTHYEANQADFTEPATITFTHVFVRGHDEDSGIRAESLLRELNQQAVSFDQATRHGQRFVYHVNYVERPRSEIADHFGQEMAEELFTLKPNTNKWRGVMRSEHGYHLVLLTAANPSRQLSFAAVRDQVLTDYNAHTSHARQREFVEGILADFQVEVAPELIGDPQ